MIFSFDQRRYNRSQAWEADERALRKDSLEEGMGGSGTGDEPVVRLSSSSFGPEQSVLRETDVDAVERHDHRIGCGNCGRHL